VDNGCLSCDIVAMNSFLGKEKCVDKIEDANTIIIPIPLEYSTSYGKGTARGPEAILNASPYLEFYDEELDCEVWKTGIYTAPAINVSADPVVCLSRIGDMVTSYLKEEKFIIALGGEHSLTSAVHEALYNKYPGISVLQFDAHSDLRDSYEGSKFSHACVMRRVWEKNNNIVGIGIRAQCLEEKQFISENRIPIYYAHELYDKEFPLNILDTLNEDVYITFDTDFFDPSIMPAVGTPEPGGFYWYETLSFLKKVFEHKNVVGMDIVEFSPVKNLTHPDFFLAKFVYKLIGYKINK